MHLWSDDLENYLAKYSQEEEPILKELNRETYIKVSKPQMLSGHIQGVFLAMISKLIKPEYILEVGTYTGYSAICMAKGLREGGQLHTIDNNLELKAIAERYIHKAGFSDKITLHQGNALDIIPEIKYAFDLAFIDADKENYANYYEMILPKISKGGVILIDNVLWKGTVLGESPKKGKITQTLHQFNQMLSKDTRVEKVILSIRDGLTLVRKL